MSNPLVRAFKELSKEIESCYNFCEYVILSIVSIPNSFLTIKDAKESLEKDRKKLDDFKKYISNLDTRLHKFDEITKSKTPFSLNIMFTTANEAYNLVLSQLELRDKNGYGNKRCIDIFWPERAADCRRYVV